MSVAAQDKPEHTDDKEGQQSFSSSLFKAADSDCMHTMYSVINTAAVVSDWCFSCASYRVGQDYKALLPQTENTTGSIVRWLTDFGPMLCT